MLSNYKVPREIVFFASESAADFLVRRVTGQSAVQSIHLEPRLIVRRTAGPVPAA